MFTYSPPYQTLKPQAHNQLCSSPPIAYHIKGTAVFSFVNHIPQLLFLDWPHMSTCIHICICAYAIYIYTYKLICTKLMYMQFNFACLGTFNKCHHTIFILP